MGSGIDWDWEAVWWLDVLVNGYSMQTAINKQQLEVSVTSSSMSGRHVYDDTS